MRKYFILFLAINVTSVYALIGGLGVNVVQDQFTINAKTDTYTLLNLDLVDFTTSEINNPVGIGGFLYLTIIPFVDFEAGYNLTFAEYEYDLVDESLAIGKGTWYTSAQYPFFSPPTIRAYIGAGINGTDWVAPVTTEKLTELAETQQDTDTDAILEALSESSSGYHIELGARFKPPLFPMSINGNARYIMDKDFHNDVDGYLTLTVGLAFAI